MTEANDSPRDGDASAADDGPDSAAMRALLRRALAGPVEPSEPAPTSAKPSPAPPSDVLRGVHKKLRKRSGGKFFADGWSTTQTRINYGLVAVVMLILLAATYVALGPMGISAP